MSTDYVTNTTNWFAVGSGILFGKQSDSHSGVVPVVLWLY